MVAVSPLRALCAVLLLLATAGLTSAQTRTCNTLPVPQCKEKIARDVVFLVDASESLDPTKFYGAMLNYLQSLWCALNTNFNNRGAVITFGQQIKIQVPLQTYTATSWFDQIEVLRQDTTLCCHCCTPTAEAFTMARQMLLANRLPGERSTIIFVVTDGDPWQNTAKTPGTIWTWPKTGAAKYRYQIVPQQSNALKAALPDVRIMLVGVPNKSNQPPAVGYFAGVPDPKKYPKGTKSGFNQCVKRGTKYQCAVMRFPPFPIVSLPLDKNLFAANAWNVKDLLNQTATDLCRVRETNAPTLSPTTSVPTNSPTERIRFEGLDLYMYIDRSKSMRWRADICRQAPGANKTADDTQVCWQLFMRFAETLVANATNIHYPTAQSPRFGWQANRTKISQGLRVWIYGFACTDQQSVPVVELIGEKISSQEAFSAAMAQAKLIVPNGGTCPSAALERSLGMIMKNDLLERPYKAGVLMTDGVFYDQPKPHISIQGLRHFGMLTYALGIAIPDNGNNNGLTPAEITDQKKQLLDFADNDKTRLLNLGAEGLLVLDSVASGIIKRLPSDVEAQFPFVVTQPYYCGFTNNERCLNTDPATFSTALYCKWIPNNWSNFAGNGRCMDKTWCSWATRALCDKDKFCKWSGGKCVYDKTVG